MTENQPEHINTFSKGANRDGNPEIIFSQAGNGIYMDARNASPVSNDGDKLVLEKMKGEELTYPNAANSVGYKCIGSISVNEDLVEFWAPTNISFPGIVRVNGVIVLSSVDFELRVDYPLQIDKNPSANFSEVAFTDKRSVPYVLDITDMVNSLISDPNKYFSAFNPKLYQVNLQSPLDIPVFVEMVNVGGGGGLPVGHYHYQMRYATKDGDRTAWSHPTPMIPIMQSLSSESRQYPWVKTFGGPPNPSSVTSLAPKLRFRVTNLFNYDYIEIKRTAYNAGAGIEYTSNGIIVAKVDVSPGEISVREYIDPAESNVNVPLSAEDESRYLSSIETAGSVRYFDNRLVFGDIKFPSRETNLTFKQMSGKEGFPIMDKMSKEGHSDPWNHTYRKKYMSGEKYGFGVVVFDGVGTSSLAQKIDQLKDYQFPNRRDQVSADTQNYSLGGTVTAATSQVTSVGQTHEVFDLVEAIAKSDKCSFKNIIEKGRVLGLTGTKTTGSVKEDCDQTNAEIENYGADVTSGTVSVSYQPFHPVKQTDSNNTGHNYIVNTKVAKKKTIADPTPDPADRSDYSPVGFGPNYFSMGICIPGVQNLPSWARAFSVVRTEAAKRVVCQGLGYYKLTKGQFKFIVDTSLGGKEQDKVWFYSPDIENGIVSSETVNDIIDNPQNYSLQFVSPLGFFSEWYSAESKLSLTNPERDRCIDMISYVRMLRDNATNPQINPFEASGWGISGGDGFNYVRHEIYRNTGGNPNTFNSSPDKGNKIIGISGAKRVSEGRGNYIELQASELFYSAASVGGITESSFDDAGLKNWTEPIYIINIVRTGAEVKDKNIQEYKSTGHYQKLESIIGKGNGLPNQKYLLVDERWEDCIPAPKSTQYGASADRYVYVQNPDGTEYKWINVTHKTVAQKSLIIANINSNVTPDIKGVYTHNNIDGKDRFFELIFNEPDFYPADGTRIVVKYDDTAPIRVFGGDTYVGEAIFAPIDSQASARDKEAETQFAFGIGLPYRDFKINPRYYTIRKAGASLNAIQDKEWFTLGFIRQLCVMFTVESRSAMHLSYNAGYPNQSFPLMHYAIRPNRWDPDKSYKDNHVFEDYGDDYGADEKTQWKWGGFRFKQQVNPDYSVEMKSVFFSKPAIGFTEKLEHPTMIMWSLPRAINVQDAPGLRTFPANNNYILDDDQGAIKYVWDANSERGENLYSIHNTGIAILLTKKSILSDNNGGNVGYMAADGFVKSHIWLNKETGMYDKMWRGAAEAFVVMPQENGTEIKVEALFFPSKMSVYRLMNNTLVDIGRGDYYSKVYGEGVSKILSGVQVHITGVYNNYTQQYWLHINGNSVNNTFMYGQRTQSWHGMNDFKFDKFTAKNNQIYGHRDMKTYELGKGYTVNGSPVVFEVITAAAPEQAYDKEFIRVRINSSDKPTRVEFYKDIKGLLQCALDSGIQGSLYLKNYRGYEQYIPRLDANVSPQRLRFQQRLIVYKIIHNLASEFKLIDSTIQYKKLK